MCGYDMRWRVQDAAERDAMREAREELHKLWAIRDAFPKEQQGRPWTLEEMQADDFDPYQAHPDASEAYRAAHDEAHQAYEAMQQIEQSYFRLNIWGMPKCCEIMEALGMAFGGYSVPKESGPWPSAKDYGLSEEIYPPEILGAVSVVVDGKVRWVPSIDTDTAPRISGG